MTKYAKKILEIVETSHSHMTAEQIFEVLRQTYPNVVLATVYNNLNKLWNENLIRKVSAEGMPDRYDRMEKHDHLMCRQCGKLIDVSLKDLTETFEKQLGFSILSYDLKLLYICEDCLSRNSDSTDD